MRHRSRTFGPARKALAVLVAAAAVGAVAVRVVPLPAGLGIQPTGIIGAGSAPVAAGKAATITVYLVKDGKLVPVVRPGLPGHPYLGVTQLGVPVTSVERRNGLRTEVPGRLEIVVRQDDRPEEITVDVGAPIDGIRIVGGEGAGEDEGRARERLRAEGWSRVAMAQVVCTAQTVPGVRRIVLAGVREEASRSFWLTLSCRQFDDLLA